MPEFPPRSSRNPGQYLMRNGNAMSAMPAAARRIILDIK
jgi:hypothetical protein